MSSWQERSAESIRKRGLTSRQRDVPQPEVPVDLEPGKVYPTAALPAIEIAAGVKASLSWGRGTLLEWLEMAPGATYPDQSMRGELITAVQRGSATCTLDNETLELSSGSFLYLTEGMRRSLQAGPEGLVAMEVFSPVRPDHLALAGTPLPAGADITFPDQGVEASLEAGKVYSGDAIPRKPILMPGRDPAAKPTAHTTLMWGRNFMLSFIRMDGNSSFPHHFHPEDQLMIVLQGDMQEGIDEGWHPMSGDNLDVILQPGGMVHAASISPEGVDVVDVFWPVRPDYMAMVQ